MTDTGGLETGLTWALLASSLLPRQHVLNREEMASIALGLEKTCRQQQFARYIIVTNRVSKV